MCIKTGHIVWVNGPFPPGLYSDYKIFMEEGLKDNLEHGERVEADDGYMAADPQFACVKSSIFHNEDKQKMRNSVRARHETVNKRLKDFKILSEVFHHEHDKHGTAFLRSQQLFNFL